MQEAVDATLGVGDHWHKAGLLEYLDFSDPASLDNLVQRFQSTFMSPAEAYVNALVCWLWCEVSNTGAPPKRRPTTAFPYGVEGIEPLSTQSVCFSSRSDDGGACAFNWRNVCIPLSKTVLVPTNTTFTVETEADLTSSSPSYQFVVRVQGETVRPRDQNH